MRIGTVGVVLACLGCSGERSAAPPARGSGSSADAAAVTPTAPVATAADVKKVYDELALESITHDASNIRQFITGKTALAPQRIELSVEGSSDPRLAKGFCEAFGFTDTPVSCAATGRSSPVKLKIEIASARATIEIAGSLRFGFGVDHLQNTAHMVLSWPAPLTGSPALLEGIGKRAAVAWYTGLADKAVADAQRLQALAPLVRWHARPWREPRVEPLRQGKRLVGTLNFLRLLVDPAGRVWSVMSDGPEGGTNLTRVSALDDRGAIAHDVHWIEDIPLTEGRYSSFDRDGALLAAVQGLESVDNDTVIPSTRGADEDVFIVALDGAKATIAAHLPGLRRMSEPIRSEDDKLYIVVVGKAGQKPELVQVAGGSIASRWVLPIAPRATKQRCALAWAAPTQLLLRCTGVEIVAIDVTKPAVTQLEGTLGGSLRELERTSISDGGGGLVYFAGSRVVRRPLARGPRWSVDAMESLDKLVLLGGRVAAYGKEGLSIHDLASGKVQSFIMKMTDAVAPVDAATFVACHPGELVAYRDLKPWKRVPFHLTSECEDVRVRADGHVVVTLSRDALALAPISEWPALE